MFAFESSKVAVERMPGALLSAIDNRFWIPVTNILLRLFKGPGLEARTIYIDVLLILIFFIFLQTEHMEIRKPASVFEDSFLVGIHTNQTVDDQVRARACQNDIFHFTNTLYLCAGMKPFEGETICVDKEFEPGDDTASWRQKLLPSYSLYPVRKAHYISGSRESG
jgi:hypothetical protein